MNVTVNATKVLEERLIPLAEAYATLGAPEIPRGLARTIHTFPEGGAYVSTLEDLARKGYEERLNTLRKKAIGNVRISTSRVQQVIRYYEGRIHSPLKDYTSVIPSPPPGNREDEEWIIKNLDFPITRWDKHYSTVKCPWYEPFEQFLIAWNTALEELSYVEYAEARVERLYEAWAGKKFEEEKKSLSQPKSRDSSKPLLDLHKREDHLYAWRMMLGRLTFDEAIAIQEMFTPLYEREGSLLLERLIREGERFERWEMKKTREGERGASYAYYDMKRDIEEPLKILKEYQRRGGSQTLREGIREVERHLHAAYAYYMTRTAEETIQNAPYAIGDILTLTEEGILEELIAKHPPGDPLREQLDILRRVLKKGGPLLRQLKPLLQEGSEEITELHKRRKGRKDDEYVPLIFYTT